MQEMRSQLVYQRKVSFNLAGLLETKSVSNNVRAVIMNLAGTDDYESQVGSLGPHMGDKENGLSTVVMSQMSGTKRTSRSSSVTMKSIRHAKDAFKRKKKKVNDDIIKEGCDYARKEVFLEAIFVPDSDWWEFDWPCGKMIAEKIGYVNPNDEANLKQWRDWFKEEGAATYFQQAHTKRCSNVMGQLKDVL